MMGKKRLGFAMTGSFCTWSSVIPQMEKLTEFYEIYQTDLLLLGQPLR